MLVIDSYVALTAVAAIAITLFGIAAERRNARSAPGTRRLPVLPALDRAA